MVRPLISLTTPTIGPYVPCARFILPPNRPNLCQ